MINETIESCQRISQGASQLEVKMKINLNRFFTGKPMEQYQPIFDKRCFEYDKYELAKIIDFNQLELLFRPFKNKPYFKKTRKNMLVSRYAFLSHTLSSLVWFLFLFFQILNVWIWIIGFCLLMVLQFLGKRYFSNRSQQGQNLKLSNYCMAISYQDVQIKFSNAQFTVKSKKVKEDLDRVKLYSKYKIQGMLNYKILSRDSFNFNQNRLNQIIPFNELQRLLQPFKSNQTYQKHQFWLFFAFVLFCSFLLSFSFVIITAMVSSFDIQQNIWSNVLIILTIIIVAICLISFIMFQLIKREIKRLRKKIVQELIKYCQEISHSHSTIEVIPHVNELSQTDIYCLQVKRKRI